MHAGLCASRDRVEVVGLDNRKVDGGLLTRGSQQSTTYSSLRFLSNRPFSCKLTSLEAISTGYGTMNASPDLIVLKIELYQFEGFSVRTKNESVTLYAIIS